jgi:hypothetical protein
MKNCPQCNRTYSDATISFCLADGAILTAPYEPKIKPLNLQTTRRFYNPADIDGAPEKRNHSEWRLLYLGLSLCLLSGISLGMLRDTNTKKLLRANGDQGYDIAMFLLLVIFFVGTYLSATNLRKIAVPVS